MASTEGAGSAPLNPNGEDVPMMVHVTAPATLAQGYTFEANINNDPDKVFNCTVPEGGVREGMIFMAPLPPSYNGARLRSPTGKWKDGTFDVFKAGFCHASLCCSLFCNQLAMGQAITRMNLTWLGEAGSWLQAKRAFGVVCILVSCFIVYTTTLKYAEYGYEDAADVPAWIPAMAFVGNFCFSVWAIYSLCRVRESTRARYQIPETTQCGACEDLCCSIWCSCCVTAQILRHTGEYETHPGVCCTPTGHAAGTPTIV